MIDLFCGTGGFAHGFSGEYASFDLVYAVDADRSAVGTTRLNHPHSRVDHADIRSIEPKVLAGELGVKEVDLIVGGPPCQGFSSLRPNRSSTRQDERNVLFLNFAGFVESFRPTYFVLENVVGLATHRGGSTLEQMLDRFSSLGYALDWRILNSSHYGVPQKRERFILIGARENGPVRFPAPTHYSDARVIGYSDSHRMQAPARDLPGAVTVEQAIGDLPWLERGESADSYGGPPATPYQKARRADNHALTLHTASKHSDKMLEVIKLAGSSISALPAGMVTSGFSTSYSRLSADEPANTITVKFQSPASNRCIHPTQNRTITPREAARIQSFDDDYVFTGSLTEIASQIGNAVPPLLGTAIAKSIVPELA